MGCLGSISNLVLTIIARLDQWIRKREQANGTWQRGLLPLELTAEKEVVTISFDVTTSKVLDSGNIQLLVAIDNVLLSLGETCSTIKELDAQKGRVTAAQSTAVPALQSKIDIIAHKSATRVAQVEISAALGRPLQHGTKLKSHIQVKVGSS